MEGTDVSAEDVAGTAARTERAAPARPRSFVGGWAITAALTVIAVLLYQIRIALLPFVFAVAVAFVTDPLIRALQQRLGTRRWPVAAVLYLLILMILAGAVYWIGTTAFGDLMYVVACAPDILRHFLSEVIGSQGIILFGQIYTPEKIVQATGGALQGMVGSMS